MQFKRAGEGAGFVMVDAETSYMAGGNFLDMEEGIASQNHLKPWKNGGMGRDFRLAQPRRR
jgi:hypothetical protein